MRIFFHLVSNTIIFRVPISRQDIRSAPGGLLPAQWGALPSEKNILGER